MQGLEPGINLGSNQQGECVDSLKRYIYFHGTNREDLVDAEVLASHGCIRVKNNDIKMIFSVLEVGDDVFIYRDKSNFRFNSSFNY